MSFWIALRYFFSRRNFTLVNIISVITLVSIVFITASMFLVLSIFNGFGLFHHDLSKKSTPDLKIEHANKPTFNIEPRLFSILESYHSNSLIDFSKVLEREIIIQNSDKKSYAIIKGVDSNYKKIYPSFQRMFENDLSVFREFLPEAITIESDFFDYGFGSFLNNSDLIIVGEELASKIDLKVYDNYSQEKLWTIWYLKQNQNSLDLAYEDNLKIASIFNFGEASIDNTIIIKVEELQNIFNFFEYSYIELNVKNEDINIIQEKIQNDLGNNFLVKNRLQQAPFIFKIIRTEKLVVYLIFTLIIIITMITLIGSIFILINQKKQDIIIFSSLGYSSNSIRSIFSYLGFLIVSLGFILGVIIGLVLCLIQQATGVITLDTPLGLVPYPVDFNFADILIIALLILGIGFITSNIVSRLVFLRKRI
tara:strand:+ start:1181 stop:2449 length:1269 start_codon:yes stop_codon:yes gene_type:complete